MQADLLISRTTTAIPAGKPAFKTHQRSVHADSQLSTHCLTLEELRSLLGLS